MYSPSIAPGVPTRTSAQLSGNIESPVSPVAMEVGALDPPVGPSAPPVSPPVLLAPPVSPLGFTST
ncbi:hypothetical protein [Nannocystis sp.]|uniref:hypothetical protein n=1 Tax=Nannocystis sp. TaxID=1962667 RepID=UPI0025F6BF30|nr:hypothetical protein [Nannocystis sp.]